MFWERFSVSGTFVSRGELKKELFVKQCQAAPDVNPVTKTA